MIHTKSSYTNDISNGYIAAQLLSEFKRQPTIGYHLSRRSFHLISAKYACSIAAGIISFSQIPWHPITTYVCVWWNKNNNKENLK